jgi:hypothetical protein
LACESERYQSIELESLLGAWAAAMEDIEQLVQFLPGRPSDQQQPASLLLY